MHFPESITSGAPIVQPQPKLADPSTTIAPKPPLVCCEHPTTVPIPSRVAKFQSQFEPPYTLVTGTPVAPVVCSKYPSTFDLAPRVAEFQPEPELANTQLAKSAVAAVVPVGLDLGE
jgi:hypothetical protein